MSMKESLTIEELFDLNETIAAEYLRQFTYPWEALGGIREYIKELGPTLDPEIYEQRGETVWVAKSAKIYPSAYLGEYIIIGEETEVRHCAFLRGDAIVGNHCVVGNSAELKNVILFNNVETPHYNYVGDSILGFHAHMGAGSITSNIKADRKNIVIHSEEGKIETGRRKIGAILGDYVEVGCNAVLNPGTVVGKYAMIYPTTCARGVIPAKTIVNNKGEVKEKIENDLMGD